MYAFRVLCLSLVVLCFHIFSLLCEKELNPLQKAGLIGRTLFESLHSKSMISDTKLSHRRGHRNNRPKRVRIPVNAHYHPLPIEKSLIASFPMMASHPKHMIFPVDGNQYDLPMAHIPVPVHLTDMDSHFIRGSADDYLLPQEHDPKKELHSNRHPMFSSSESNPIELSDANIMALFDLDQRPNSILKRPNLSTSGLIRMPSNDHSVSLPLFTDAQSYQSSSALASFAPQSSYSVPPPQNHQAWFPSSSHAFSRLSSGGQVPHQLTGHEPEATNEYAYEMPESRPNFGSIDSNRRLNELLSLDLMPYSIQHEYQNVDVSLCLLPKRMTIR
jgi:hypothetical protein